MTGVGVSLARIIGVRIGRDSLKKLKILGLSCLLFSSSSLATSIYLDNLMKVISPDQSHTGVIVKDFGTDKVLFEHHSDTLALPASTLKLLTAVTALSVLGEDFSYKTQMYSQAPLTNGSIIGDVYLVFNGDPTLERVDLKALLKQLKNKGLQKIHGKLLLVGESQTQLQAPGWVWDDLGICFAAPVSSFIIGKNCINAILKPKLASYYGVLSVANYLPVMLTTSAVFDKNLSKKFCELNLNRHGDNRFHLGGCYPGNTRIRLADAIDNPNKYAIDTLAQILKNQGIRALKGLEIRNKKPQNISLLASHSSAPLNTLLNTMLLESDNLIADSLIKQIGKQFYNQAGDFTTGVAAMKKLLKQRGIDLDTAQISDGSGLSRYNLISPAQLMQVLTLIESEPSLRHIIDSLPVAGVSGTLKHQGLFKDPKLKNKVLAKTGSMQGVSNLAGFIKDKKGKPRYGFVIFENGLSPNAKQNQVAPFNALFLQGLLDKNGGLVNMMKETRNGIASTEDSSAVSPR